MDLRISTSAPGSSPTVVAVAGDIDLNTAPQLAAALEGVSGPVVVDLEEVGFLDSSALGVLVGAHKRLVAAGGSLAVVCSSPMVLKIFQITRLTEVLAVHESRDAAGV